ncbi:YbaB/EbfC family nucleoid-associated protein [Lentzea sp. PSKA42]|uniref:YbaB/EbfC family nucleoid-associated protein n=1 Tax=Lentzea indica TaxID=2604800 RepID=A0ABX1FYF6_9PSEU|nr:YbaB/EbfC family nucleoid-associated protein [Lentzea indica]NKE63532.1 YbaB/EbfC family nucleoid-associated protein [Lentzea indica]
MPDRRAQLEEKIRAFQEQAAKAGQLKDKISELRGQARSGDGSVIVTVAPSGAVLGLQLSPNAMKYSHTQLQQEILATIRAATQQAAQMLQDTVTPVLGDQAERFKDAFNAHSSVMMPDAPPQNTAQQHMPPPQQQHMAPPPPQNVSRPAPGNRPRPAPVSDDDDFGGNSILR